MRLAGFTLLLPLLAAAAAPTPIQPGKWQTTLTVVDARFPGAPPQMLAALRAHPTVVTACLTPNDAANGPRAVLQRSNGRCRMTSYSMAGGRISSVMQCAGPRGATTARSTGTYTPTTMTATSQVTGADGTSMTSRMTSRRLGGC